MSINAKVSTSFTGLGNGGNSVTTVSGNKMYCITETVSGYNPSITFLSLGLETTGDEISGYIPLADIRAFHISAVTPASGAVLSPMKFSGGGINYSQAINSGQSWYFASGVNNVTVNPFVTAGQSGLSGIKVSGHVSGWVGCPNSMTVTIKILTV